MDILFMVDFDDTGKHGRGCHKVTDSFLQIRWNCSRNKVRSTLKLFKQLEMIELKSSKKIPKLGTMLKVTNYAYYQDFSGGFGTIKSTIKSTINGTQTKEYKELKNNFMLKKLSDIESPDDLEDGWFRNGFLECWKIYPKKVGKKEALKSWCKVHKKNKFQKQLAEDIYRGLQRYISQTEDKDKEFIAHFSTWLNQRRWEDEETISINHQKKPKAFEQWSESDDLPDLTLGSME